MNKSCPILENPFPNDFTSSWIRNRFSCLFLKSTINDTQRSYLWKLLDAKNELLPLKIKVAPEIQFTKIELKRLYTNRSYLDDNAINAFSSLFNLRSSLSVLPTESYFCTTDFVSVLVFEPDILELKNIKSHYDIKSPLEHPLYFILPYPEGNNFFTYKFIVVPLHNNDPAEHWTLGVIDIVNHTVYVLNSGIGEHSRAIDEKDGLFLIKYAEFETKFHRKDSTTTTWKLNLDIVVPQQNDTSNDCGVFVILFMDCLLRRSYINGIMGEYGRYDLQKHISSHNIRKTLCALLLHYETDYLSKEATPIPDSNDENTKVIVADSSSVHNYLGHFGNKKSPVSSYSKLLIKVNDVGKNTNNHNSNESISLLAARHVFDSFQKVQNTKKMESTPPFNEINSFAIALSNNYVFDLGFKMFNSNHQPLKLNSCPCALFHDQWRNSYNIPLDPEDGCYSRMYTNDELITHLTTQTSFKKPESSAVMQSRQWMHQVIFQYIKSSYSSWIAVPDFSSQQLPRPEFCISKSSKSAAVLDKLSKYEHIWFDFDLISILKLHNKFHATADKFHEKTSHDCSTIIPDVMINETRIPSNTSFIHEIVDVPLLHQVIDITNDESVELGGNDVETTFELEDINEGSLCNSTIAKTIIPAKASARSTHDKQCDNLNSTSSISIPHKMQIQSKGSNNQTPHISYKDRCSNKEKEDRLAYNRYLYHNRFRKNHFRQGHYQERKHTSCNDNRVYNHYGPKKTLQHEVVAPKKMFPNEDFLVATQKESIVSNNALPVEVVVAKRKESIPDDNFHYEEMVIDTSESHTNKQNKGKDCYVDEQSHDSTLTNRSDLKRCSLTTSMSLNEDSLSQDNKKLKSMTSLKALNKNKVHLGDKKKIPLKRSSQNVIIVDNDFQFILISNDPVTKSVKSANMKRSRREKKTSGQLAEKLYKDNIFPYPYVLYREVIVYDETGTKHTGEVNRILPNSTGSFIFKVVFLSKFYLIFGIKDFIHVYRCTIEPECEYACLPFTYNSIKKKSNAYFDQCLFDVKNKDDYLLGVCQEEEAVIISHDDKHIHDYPKDRNPKGTDILYCIKLTCIKTITVKSTRYNQFKLEKEVPGTQLAFCGNTNLHKAPVNGSGMLCMLHYSHHHVVLAILINGNMRGGTYLIWSGNDGPNSLHKDYINDLCSFTKNWRLQYVSNDNVKGCYVNQVFGPSIMLIKSQPLLYFDNDNEYFKSNVQGPDIIMLPPSRMYNQLNIIEKTKEYTLIYCPLRVLEKQVSKLGILSVPIDNAVLVYEEFKVGTFIDVSIITLSSIENNISINEFIAYISKEKIGNAYKRLIPPINTNIQIRVIYPEQFELLKSDGKFLQVEQHDFVIRSKCNRTNENALKGVLLSSIGKDLKIQDITMNINFETIEELHHVYGKGNKRQRCDHIGFASYRGSKNTNRPHPRPFVSSDTISEHQYFNEMNNNHQLAQPFIENIVNELGENAMLFGRKEYPDLFNIINSCCMKGIITSGSPHCFKKFYSLHSSREKMFHVKYNTKNNFLSFACSSHEDKCDNLCKGKLYDHFINKCSNSHMKEMVKMLGPTMPTTCQYKHIWNDTVDFNDYYVMSYFVYDSLGIAQYLYDSCSIVFLGAKFKHFTTVCYLIHKVTKTIIIRNNDNTFTVFAWGRTGGSVDYENSVNENYE